MSLDARLSLLWTRLQSRYKASQRLNGGEPPQIIEAVLPVTDADELLAVSSIKAATVSITGGAAVFSMFTVPAGKKWTVMLISAELVTGTYTINKFSFWDATGTNGSPVYRATSAAWLLANLYQGLPLEPGWQITVDSDTYSVTGNLAARAIVKEEDVF